MWGQPQKHSFKGPAVEPRHVREAVNLLPTLSPRSPEQMMVDCKAGCLRYTLCKPLKCYDYPKNALDRKGNGACHPPEPMRCQQEFNLHRIGPWATQLSISPQHAQPRTALFHQCSAVEHTLNSIILP